MTQSKLQVELAKRGSELIQLTRELKEQQHVIQDAEAVIRRNALPARSVRQPRDTGAVAHIFASI